MHRRERLLGDASSQPCQPNRSIRAELTPGLQRRSGTSKKQPTSTAADAINGKVSGVITGHGRLLLVRPVVLFIEDNQSDRLQRGKHRRTGSHHKQGLICCKTLAPDLQTFPVATTAVVFEHLLAEATPATIHQLGNQTNFRSQQQHMPAGLQFSRSKLQIHLRFAGAGDAPEQEAFSGIEGAIGLNGLALFIGELLGAFSCHGQGVVNRLPTAFLATQPAVRL